MKTIAFKTKNKSEHIPFESMKQNKKKRFGWKTKFILNIPFEAKGRNNEKST